MLAGFLPGADHLQNPHPLVVHFPIAFLYGAALLYFLAWLTRRDSIAWAALWFLVLGLIAAAIAVGTGWWAAPGVMLDPSVKENVLEPHKRLMLATSAIAAVLTLWAIIRRPMPVSAARYLLPLRLAADDRADDQGRGLRWHHGIRLQRRRWRVLAADSIHAGPRACQIENFGRRKPRWHTSRFRLI